ncbi:hypothetical protein PVL29_020314 [Vitis rotundifolia]|uniref:Uncharacterized protein n=1 Tax=Vitis rotundifolia TaxID=103349 RepID=A0AA39DEY1_VITRO|nr:hypothetical protein PVL29_020314 [Vitis rotundifolia]
MTVSIYGQNASGTSDADRLAQIIHGCKAVALLSCTEFKSESTCQELIGKPVIPVGLLSSEKYEGRETTDGHGMKSW